MLRTTRFISWAVSFALAAIILAAPLAAQTRSANASASVTVVANLSLSKTADMQFGSHFASEGTIPAQGGNGAQWQGQTDPGNHLSFSFALPGTLDSPTGGHVAFSCGSTSASWHNGPGIGGSFNPNAGLSDTGQEQGDGSFVVGLSGGQSGSDVCTVSLTGARGGVYTGQITLTVTVL